MLAAGIILQWSDRDLKPRPKRIVETDGLGPDLEEEEEEEEDSGMTTFEIRLALESSDNKIQVRASDYDQNDNYTDFSDEDDNIVLSVQTRFVVWIKDLELAKPEEKAA